MMREENVRDDSLGACTVAPEGVDWLDPVQDLPSLARAEWIYMQHVLRICRGNRSEAARRLGIHRSVLQRKLSRTPPIR